MAARKLAQEVDKTFKKIDEGVAEFSSIYEKIEQSNNPAQKEKLEDNLKREIKKLQRLRDQIKTWTASNEIKDKAPLMEKRRLIETQMEKFKAVEKAMKTKAYSKEGLSAAAKRDPKEQAKSEASEFLCSMVDALEQQIEILEAEGVTLQASSKKGKLPPKKQARYDEIETIITLHKWHQGKLELIRRSLENGGVEAEQVTDLEDDIRYYVSDCQNPDFVPDDTMYDDLHLGEDEDHFGMNQDTEAVSSLDAQSQQDDAADADGRSGSAAGGKGRAPADVAGPTGRRPSAQLKSPLPTLATLHTPSLPPISSGVPSGNAAMKPASVPARPPGEGLKYASAAAAAAASDKNNFGIAPLPPPPGAQPVPAAPSLPPVQAKTSSTSSPSVASIQPATTQPPEQRPIPAAQAMPTSVPTPKSTPKTEPARISSRAAGKAPASVPPAEAPKAAPKTNGVTNGVRAAAVTEEPAMEAGKDQEEAEECIYHLPASLHDLVDALEAAKKRQPASVTSPSAQRMVAASRATAPEPEDALPPSFYQPERYWNSNPTYPREPLSIFRDPRLYPRLDNDTLFFAFYYQQGSYQQFLSAKALKDQAWRFHKQYQTWFQRHEEPKSITEEFEQGTYRFFDYESTWMNRRKAEFKFAYKFLEDDV